MRVCVWGVFFGGDGGVSVHVCAMNDDITFTCDTREQLTSVIVTH